MPANPIITDARWLETARTIADHLCDSAYRYDGECTWMGTLQQGGVDGPATFTYESLGPDLYGGASGIALFLAEAFEQTGHDRYADVAREALAFSAARCHRIPHRFRHGFYAGRTGISFALARTGQILEDGALIARARKELTALVASGLDDMVLDVISGAAGAVAPALSLAASLAMPALNAHAAHLGEQVISNANRGDDGWSWGDDATGFHSHGPLTGYGHGAAGMGLALLELFDVTRDARFRDGAREAFRFERSLFSVTRDNWPDLRYSSDATDSGHFGVAWCLGAAGVGLSRARARDIDPSLPERRDELDAARHSTQRRVRTTEIGRDFSLCHGSAGLGDIALIVARLSGSDVARSLALEIATSGADSNSDRPASWGCGIRQGSNPSLMLGLAGIGHFYLRLADPSLPSLLMPMGTGRAEGRSALAG